MQPVSLLFRDGTILVLLPWIMGFLLSSIPVERASVLSLYLSCLAVVLFPCAMIWLFIRSLHLKYLATSRGIVLDRSDQKKLFGVFMASVLGFIIYGMFYQLLLVSLKSIG